MLNGSTLIVVADGARARFLLRELPGAPLVEYTDLEMTIRPSAFARLRSAHAYDRTSAGRHALMHRPTAREIAVYDFLAEVADKIADVVQRESCAHLALCVAPGLRRALTATLSPEVRKKLAFSLGKNVCGERWADLDRRLRELRV